MKKRIFLSLTLITFLSTFIFNVFIAFFMYKQLTDQESVNLKSEASYISQVIENNFTSFSYDLDKFQTKNRITVISSLGDVLYDNLHEYTSMENHLYRPEIQSALKSGSGSDSRLSKTLGSQTFYYAQKLENDNILRISFTTSSIYSMIYNSMPTFLLMSIVFIFISLTLSKHLTNYIINPIHPSNPDIYDELLPFVKKIDSQQKYIDQQKYELEQRILEFDAISENIADGLILLDTNAHIISINEQAVKILGNTNLSYVSKPFINLTRIIKIQDCVKRAYKGELVDSTNQIRDNFYSFRFSPVMYDLEVLGVVVLIVDNTIQIQNDQLRREFSANVSHELKTPLTSISGYAELIKTGIVKPDDIVPFAEKICNETAHLIDLIEDIIKVSKLDESHESFDFSSINLKDLIDNIAYRLESFANKSNISIKLELFDVNINAVSSILNEIFYNLIENSIKYNKPSGNVLIKMSILNEYVVTEIVDTGIGIPHRAVSRIFERFYRADTSHSSEISGSGLGLSIVKNGINLHGGQIEVTSVENIGTTFKVFLKTSTDTL